MRFNLLMCFIFLFSVAFGQAEWDRVQIVGNNTGVSSFSKKQITLIFKGKKSRWDNDENITVVLPSSKHKGCEVMAKTIFSADMKFVKRYWLSIVFQGRADAPVYLDSNDDILDYIEKHSGAVGILIDSNKKSKFSIAVE